MQKIRVGVLMGGKSIEREVSFNSGRTVCDHLDTQRYDIVPLFQDKDGSLFVLPWQFLHRGKIQDFVHKLPTHAQQIIWDEVAHLVDFVFIATHGRYAEDGILQATLELFSIPYIGSGIFASALSMDKIIQKSFLRSAGIAVPRDITVTAAQATDPNLPHLLKQLEQNNIAFPVVVKPHMEGSSLGVDVVFSADQLCAAVVHAATISEKPQAVLIEQKITGMEFSCIVLTDYRTGKLMPLPPTEIVPEANSHLFDYEQKYMPGRATKYTPPRCTPEVTAVIQETVMRTMKALSFTTMARIDGFVDANNQIVIVDPNILSGMAPSSFLFREAAEIGMGHSDLINHLIETELHQYGMLAPLEKQEQSKGQSMNKTRVAVLLGGASNEREISLESGRNVVYKLSPHKYDVTPIFVSSTMQLYPISQSLLVRNATYEIEPLLTQESPITWHSLKERFDFVFLGLHGGQGEDGTVQGMLEMLGIPYNGSSVLASSLCMDKYKTAQYLAEHNIPVPQGMLITKEQWEEKQDVCLEQCGVSFPVIVKPPDDGCSVLVSCAETKEQLIEHLNALFKKKKNALIEEYIVGIELTVGVIGNDEPIVLPPSQSVAQHGVLSIEEKFLPGEGENQTPAPLGQEATTLVQQMVKDAYCALGCKGYARIDCFYQTAEQSPTGEPRVVILEVNTLPALTPATCLFHQAAEIGLRPMELLDQIIEYGMQLHGIFGASQQKDALKSDIL